MTIMNTALVGREEGKPHDVLGAQFLVSSKDPSKILCAAEGSGGGFYISFGGIVALKLSSSDFFHVH